MTKTTETPRAVAGYHVTYHDTAGKAYNDRFVLAWDEEDAKQQAGEIHEIEHCKDPWGKNAAEIKVKKVTEGVQVAPRAPVD